jgi:NitT/TauT family transport system permease protein
MTTTDLSASVSSDSLRRRSLRRESLIRTGVNFAARAAILVLMVLLWEAVVASGWVGEFAISRPWKVWREISQLSGSGTLVRHVAITLFEATVGFGLAVVVGVSIGFALSLFGRAREIIEPFITMLNSLPRIALAPLFLIWFGFESESKIALVFTVVLFPIMINTLAGVRGIDPDIVTVSRLLGASPTQMVRNVVLPSTLPWIIAGMRLGLALALVGAVVGEMFAGQGGIGYLIAASSGQFNIAAIFAGLVTIMLIAYVLELGSRALERRLLRWREDVRLV